MRLLNFSNNAVETPALDTIRLHLRRPHGDDFFAWASLREQSQDFLQPWEPAWAWNELSRTSFRARLKQQEADINSGRGMHWFLFERGGSGALLGGLSLTNIRRGIAQTATLGYWMGEPHAGNGFMGEAVNAVCENAFEHHGLHRIEAATVLDNQRSQRLLLRCNFEREGIARQYLMINGHWRDHVLFSRIDEG